MCRCVCVRGRVLSEKKAQEEKVWPHSEEEEEEVEEQQQLAGSEKLANFHPRECSGFASVWNYLSKSWWWRRRASEKKKNSVPGRVEGKSGSLKVKKSL